MTEATGADTPGPPPPGQPRRVAIACQGGGSHTAFTAGVLSRLFDGPTPATGLDGYEVVGLSGTSGGAVCALMAWCGAARRRSAQGPGAARRVLGRQLREHADGRGRQRLAAVGEHPAERRVPAARSAPTTSRPPASTTSATCSTRRVDFDRIEADPGGRQPQLLIGAVDVLSGQFRAFNSRRERIVPDMILASAAIPTLFTTVHVADGAYRDGLFSQNPRGARPARHPARRALGDPDQPDGPRGRAQRRCSTSPTGATSWPATSRSTRSCTASR